MCFAFVVPVAVLASQAFALNLLYARQLHNNPNIVPLKCQSICNPFFTTGESCANDSRGDFTCICTPAALDSLDGCLDCFVALVEESESASESELEAFKEEADALKDKFGRSCDGASSSTSNNFLPSSTRSSTTTSRKSTSTSDDDFTSMTTSRRATTREQITERPSATDGPTNSEPIIDDNNTDPLLGQSAAAPKRLSLGGLAAAAAGALFLL